jgi:hypothetical protein
MPWVKDAALDCEELWALPGCDIHLKHLKKHLKNA